MKRFRFLGIVAVAIGLVGGIGASAPALAGTGELLAGPAPASDSSTFAASDVLRTWSDAGGRMVYMRKGTYNFLADQGFGFDKMSSKHGIGHYDAPKYVVKNPNGGVQEGTDRAYLAYANRTECYGNPQVCEVTDSIPVKAVVSFANWDTYYGEPVNGVLGLKTMYCDQGGAALCPGWVGTALFNAGLGLPDIQRAESSTDVLVHFARSYEPLLVGATAASPYE